MVPRRLPTVSERFVQHRQNQSAIRRLFRVTLRNGRKYAAKQSLSRAKLRGGKSIAKRCQCRSSRAWGNCGMGAISYGVQSLWLRLHGLRE